MALFNVIKIIYEKLGDTLRYRGVGYALPNPLDKREIKNRPKRSVSLFGDPSGINPLSRISCSPTVCFANSTRLTLRR